MGCFETDVAYSARDQISKLSEIFSLPQGCVNAQMGGLAGDQDLIRQNLAKTFALWAYLSTYLPNLYFPSFKIKILLQKIIKILIKIMYHVHYS